MKRKQKKSVEEIVADNNSSMIREIERKINLGAIPKNPTRLFNVEDPVKWGNHKNITVAKVLFDGLAYELKYDYMGQAYGEPKRMTGSHIIEWIYVFPMTAYCEGEVLHDVDDVQIRYYNNDISSLLRKVYSAGVDFNPDYQRDLVWTLEQKLSLIDSIFSNVEIGKLTFIKHDYSRDLFYEILDGKQRLSTICHFYEDRFEWRGKKFSELSFQDAWHFCSFPIIQGEVEELTPKQIYKLFVKMNTSGTPISQEHLNRIKSLI